MLRLTIHRKGYEFKHNYKLDPHILTLTNPTTSNIESQTNYELLENTWAFVNKCIMAPVGLAWLCTVCSGIPDRGFWG